MATRRHNDGRPYIYPPDGHKEKLYTRTSKLASALDDSYGLDLWHQRNLAIGLAQNQWLLDEILQNQYDVKELNAICDVARDKAGESTGSKWGTVVHWFTECIDNGWDYELLTPPEDVSRAVKYLKPDLNMYAGLNALYEDAWEDITAYEFKVQHEGLSVEEAETFVVNDEIGAAGTLDRRYARKGDPQTYIGDLKTGRIDLSIMKFTMQMAIYARSVRYTESEGSWEREPIENVSLDKALLVHIPQKAGECALLWLNIEAGWEAIEFALNLRELRRAGKKWSRGFNEPEPQPVPMLPSDAKTINDFKDFAREWKIPLEGATKKADILEKIQKAEGKVMT